VRKRAAKARQRSEEQCGNALRKRGSAPKNSAETRCESAAALRRIEHWKKRDTHTHTCAPVPVKRLKKHFDQFPDFHRKIKRKILKISSKSDLTPKKPVSNEKGFTASEPPGIP